ncbi:MAG: Ti-type conjugative transfer relaxase TraA [Gammaproteobacteria bacterium]|nr:Ti-type conjugative transfer relaxase TraA [Gammaproteobacteria bacterium]
MAIYHLNTHTIGRSAGHSAVAASAYRSGSKMTDERTGEVFDFTRKGGVLSAEIVTPEGIPVPERSALWNAAEAAEKRKDARVAREWRAALPHELNEAERRELAESMGQSLADRYGVAVDVCIHAPDKGGDDRNFHVHMLATTRVIDADGELGKKAVIELANKDRKKAGIPGTSQADIVDIRREWAELSNRALERAGRTERVDHRSYEDQGVELTPTRHVGRDAVAMDRRGLEADRIDIHNADRQEQARQITEKPEIILDKITATKAVFTRRDIASELNRYIDNPEHFQELLATLENSGKLVEMEPAKGRHPAIFSTPEMIRTERRMIDAAERLAGAGRHRVSDAVVAAAIDGVGTLSDEQKNAVRHVTNPGGLAVVIGDAGTGKSFSMKVAREAWEAQGLNVRGAALAGKAADELQAGSGIESRTLASLEYAWKEGRSQLTPRDVLVIDEAGMIGSRQLGRVLDAADQAGAKVVLLGDDKQLAAIEAGAAFRGVVQHVGAAEITEVRRQRHAWARQAGQELARGSVSNGLQAYAERGHVQMHDTREAAREALAHAYVGGLEGGSQIVLAHSNADVLALNEAIRDARKERGELAEPARFMAERGAREFAVADRVVFLRNDRDLGVKNGTLGTVERAEDGGLAVRLDSGELRQVNADKYAALDHGYAVTIHKAQGVTVDRAYLLATPSMDRSLAYVGMTRHRDVATLFAGAEDFTERRAGRLVEHGAAPFEHKPENSRSYFATLENDKGQRRTIWGVDLERAIATSGVKVGDRIGLEHDGSQTVQLPGGHSAERNTWRVRTADELARGRLTEVLSRERPKESTLDFADRRGFDGESVLSRWIQRGREKVFELADRLKGARNRIVERHGRPDLAQATDIAGRPQLEHPREIEAPATPAAERPRSAPDRLAGYRASVERAEAAGGGLPLEVAKSQLGVAQEYQAAGKDPRHHAAEIARTGEKRVFDGLRAKPEAERERNDLAPGKAPVSEQDRKRAEMAAKMEIQKFRGYAVKRQGGFAGYTDRNPKAWQALPDELRDRIERYNALPKERQAAELDKMQRSLVDRYARDPATIKQDREQYRARERGRGR